MTALLASRQVLDPRSMGDQPKRRSSKRLAAATEYERDDDFEFVRKSKRPKTEPSEPGKKTARGRLSAADRSVKEASPKPRTASAAAADASVATATAPPKTAATRRSARKKVTADAPLQDSHPHATLSAPRRPTRRSKRLSGENSPPRLEADHQDGVAATALEPSGAAQEASVESAKIMLPMSDTPVINRNKEMRRKGNSNRRSSLGSRGRRASSLIESGQSAIPHRDLDPAEFYKHIAAEGLPEPRRMKQLLIWCGERALLEKPPLGTANSGALLGARAIQDQLLKDFASRSDFSDWFSRDDDATKPKPVLKPNPRNLELDEKMAELEAKIARLQGEKNAWLAMRNPAPQPLPPLISEGESEEWSSSSSSIRLPDLELLEADESPIRDYLGDEANRAATARCETEARLRATASSLEFEVDQLADFVHKLAQRVHLAGREADLVLGLSALRLRERERRDQEAAGTKDMPIIEVLRGLGGILPEEKGGAS